MVHPDGPASTTTKEELSIFFASSPDYAGIAEAASNGLIFDTRVLDVSELRSALESAIDRSKTASQSCWTLSFRD